MIKGYSKRTRPVAESERSDPESPRPRNERSRERSYTGGVSGGGEGTSSGSETSKEEEE